MLVASPRDGSLQVCQQHQSLRLRVSAAVRQGWPRKSSLLFRNASVLSASLLWREPTGDAVNSSSGDGEGLGSQALSLLESMAAGLQVRQQASIV